MGRIYAKAQKDKLNQDLDEILAMLYDMKGTPEGDNYAIGKQKILARIKEMMAESEKKESNPIETGNSWDFILNINKIYSLSCTTNAFGVQ